MFFTNKILDRISAMLDNAISGTEIEKNFDESKISSIESKLHKYLLNTGKHKKQLEEQKLKADSLITDISHQTKTPISNIALYSELIAECNNDEDRKKYCSMLINQSEKLSFLIDSLMKTSRLENGIIAVKPKNQSIDLLFDNIEKAFSFVKITNCELSAVYDLKWTSEAVFNVIDNARKYGAGNVSVSATAYQMFLKIDVKDDGVGISEYEIPKIFGRFYRGKNSDNVEGVGIGLYLAREIITKQGGYIKVSSKVYVGSVFSVYLPLK